MPRRPALPCGYKKKLVAPTVHRPRCLGPGKPEHLMDSTALSHRVCAKCRAKQDKLNLSPLHLEAPMFTDDAHN
jgi:hypothetical protein